MTPDPIGLEGGINPFAYVLNNPVNLIDPLGLSPSFDQDNDGVIDQDSELCDTLGDIQNQIDAETQKYEFIRDIANDMAISFLLRRMGFRINTPKKASNGFKKPKSAISGKAGAKDVPSWAKGNKPKQKESGKDFAKRLMDLKYPDGWSPKTHPEYKKIQKWGDKAFE